MDKVREARVWRTLQTNKNVRRELSSVTADIRNIARQLQIPAPDIAAFIAERFGVITALENDEFTLEGNAWMDSSG